MIAFSKSQWAEIACICMLYMHTTRTRNDFKATDFFHSFRLINHPNSITDACHKRLRTLHQGQKARVQLEPWYKTTYVGTLSDEIISLERIKTYMIYIGKKNYSEMAKEVHDPATPATCAFSPKLKKLPVKSAADLRYSLFPKAQTPLVSAKQGSNPFSTRENGNSFHIVAGYKLTKRLDSILSLLLRCIQSFKGSTTLDFQRDITKWNWDGKVRSW